MSTWTNLQTLSFKRRRQEEASKEYLKGGIHWMESPIDRGIRQVSKNQQRQHLTEPKEAIYLKEKRAKGRFLHGSKFVNIEDNPKDAFATKTMY